jgi:hypothetical protein
MEFVIYVFIIIHTQKTKKMKFNCGLSIFSFNSLTFPVVIF